MTKKSINETNRLLLKKNCNQKSLFFTKYSLSEENWFSLYENIGSNTMM